MTNSRFAPKAPSVPGPHAAGRGTGHIRVVPALLAAMSLVLPGLPVLAAGKAGKPAVEEAKPAPQQAPPPPPAQPAPYDKELLRLSEILGAVHYLRGLCNPAGEDGWRERMQKLLDLEAGKEPLRRQRFTAAFNHGYRSFAAMHATCTEAALAAEARYRAEGATLATEITARFGN